MKSATPEIRSAIIKGALVEAVLLVAGVVLYLTTQNLFWVVGAGLGGAATMLLFLSQAGMFDRGDE